jgi:hypothetical protein
VWYWVEEGANVLRRGFFSSWAVESAGTDGANVTRRRFASFNGAKVTRRRFVSCCIISCVVVECANVMHLFFVSSCAVE